MKVTELPLQPVLTTRPEESLAAAADEMRFYEVGSLAVVERREIVAVITERDLARAVADRVDPSRTSVRFYMTPEPVTIDSHADVGDARDLMLAMGVRHLPVIEGNDLVGMVSIRDVLRAGAVA